MLERGWRHGGGGAEGRGGNISLYPQGLGIEVHGRLINGWGDRTMR